MEIKQELAYLRTFIKREQRMRERVLRPPRREEALVECARALDAVDAIEGALNIEDQLPLFLDQD